MNPVYFKEPLEQDAILIGVRGRLDHDSVPELEIALLELLEEGYIHLAIDMKEATYINSSGLRVLISILRASNRQGGDVVLSSLNKRLTDIFNMAGFDKVFSIWPTSDEAIHALVA
ncbi:MAG: STAS domain-containing protein [Anaerolineales bacterium]|nr:STAS domain-containing protein [Anaerolineales bacterium]